MDVTETPYTFGGAKRPKRRQRQSYSGKVMQAIELDEMKKSEASQVFNIIRNIINLWGIEMVNSLLRLRLKGPALKRSLNSSWSPESVKFVNNDTMPLACVRL